MNKTEIKEVVQGRGQLCNDLLRALPLWFGIEEAIREYVLDVEQMPTLAAYEGDPCLFMIKAL